MDTDLIGRATEVEAVGRFLERARSALASLVIHGDAGIGKTAIWRAAIEHADEAGARVLRAAPAESERTLTLGGLTDLLSTVTDAELAFLPAVQRHALEIAILRTEPSGQLPDQRTLSVATATLLRELASERPLVLAIDDAQWLDDASAAILAYAIRRLVDRPAGVLLAVRGEPGAPVLELTAGVPAERRERLPVGPLPLAALHQLLLARSGRSFPRLVLVRIEEASGGNPFYAIEIARDLARSGEVVTPGERLPIPETLGALVEARIGALPPATRAGLLLAAVAAEPTIDTLRRADPDAPGALEPALEASIVVTDRQAIRFSHPLLAQAVIALARPDELRRVHATLARTATSDDARARHLGGATEGRDESVAAALEAAAAASRDRGATLDAASLYERAGHLTPETLGDQAIRRAILAAECLFIDVSEIVQADTILETAIARATPGPARAEALSLRAIIRYYHGQTPDAVRLGDEALAEAGAPARRRGSGDRDDRAPDPGEVGPRWRRSVQSRLAVRPPGLPGRLAGRPAERRGRQRRLWTRRRRHLPGLEAAGLALVAAHDGRTDQARRRATEGLGLALASGDLALEVYHRHILGFVALSTGDVQEADVELTAAERAATPMAPTPWTLAIGARGRGLVQAASGDGDGALDALGQALVAHERLPMPFERARTLLALGQVHRRRKEKRLADERLREAVTIFEALGAPLWAERASAELARVGLRPRASHDLTETERRVAELAATGMTSRQIAERAFLAPKTVGNVLGRVYEKLGIHSRAELGARMGEGPDQGDERDRSG